MGVDLVKIQEYCDNKTIAIVGNSSNLLKTNYSGLINSADVVVRMNHGPSFVSKYSNFIGNRTDIYVGSMSKIDLVKINIDKAKAKFNLFLIRHHSDASKLEITNIPNFYIGSYQQYQDLRQKFEPPKFKPSTGAVIVNFFTKNINFDKILLFGFDFFESSNPSNRNEFNSFHYKDHSTNLEKSFFSNILTDNILIYK